MPYNPFNQPPPKKAYNSVNPQQVATQLLGNNYNPYLDAPQRPLPMQMARYDPAILNNRKNPITPGTLARHQQQIKSVFGLNGSQMVQAPPMDRQMDRPMDRLQLLPSTSNYVNVRDATMNVQSRMSNLQNKYMETSPYKKLDYGNGIPRQHPSLTPLRPALPAKLDVGRYYK